MTGMCAWARRQGAGLAQIFSARLALHSSVSVTECNSVARPQRDKVPDANILPGPADAEPDRSSRPQPPMDGGPDFFNRKKRVRGFNLHSMRRPDCAVARNRG